MDIAAWTGAAPQGVEPLKKGGGEGEKEGVDQIYAEGALAHEPHPRGSVRPWVLCRASRNIPAAISKGKGLKASR